MLHRLILKVIKVHHAPCQIVLKSPIAHLHPPTVFPQEIQLICLLADEGWFSFPWQVTVIEANTDFATLFLSLTYVAPVESFLNQSGGCEALSLLPVNQLKLVPTRLPLKDSCLTIHLTMVFCSIV